MIYRIGSALSAATPFAVNGDFTMVCATFLVCGLLTASSSDAPVSKGDLATYRQARDSAKPDADAQVKLALWCEAHGLQAERLKHLARAILVDPKNATARGLLGLVAYQGQWKRPEAVAEKVKADQDLNAKLAEYNAKRADMTESAESHMRLGLWCEENGLQAEAQAHFANVTRLEPSRETAWKKLGCKKVGGRWVTETELAAEKAEAEAQTHADKKWRPLLVKYRGWLSGKDARKRAEAAAALGGISDPRAMPSVWAVLVQNSPYHGIAVQVMGQIDTATSSRALAIMAVMNDDAEVRRAANEILRRRDPREFAGTLVAMLREPTKYQVLPVNGPGSAGVLHVEGERFDVNRMYVAPAPPELAPALLTRGPLTRQQQFDQAYNAGNLENRQAAAQFLEQFSTNPVAALSNPSNARALNPKPVTVPSRVVNSSATEGGRRAQVAMENLARAATAANAAQQQLAADVNAIETNNEIASRTNERVEGVLKDVIGQDQGRDKESWDKWWTELQGYAYSAPKKPAVKPTYTQIASLPYTPQFLPFMDRHECFGAGTLIRTLDGSCPIETIKVGDRVLTQDLKTAALGYQAVTRVHHNPPSATFLIKVKGDTIVSSPLHRFWVVGKGWVMARELLGGETLRLLDGPALIDSVEKGIVQPVYNLDIAGAHDFFAGAAAALVHDNSIPETRIEPFDANPESAAAK